MANSNGNGTVAVGTQIKNVKTEFSGKVEGFELKLNPLSGRWEMVVTVSGTAMEGRKLIEWLNNGRVTVVTGKEAAAK